MCAECYEESFIEMSDLDKDIENNDIIDPPTSEKAKIKSLTTLLERIREKRITAAVLLCLYASLLSLSAVFSHLATESGKLSAHYLTDSEHYTTFVISLICTLIFPLIALVAFDNYILEKEHLIPRILNLVPAAGAALSAFLFFYFSTASVFEADSKWAPYISFCAIISTIFFLLKMCNNRFAPNVMAGFKILTAIGVFAFSALIIVSLYLDYTTELNSHFKLSVQFGAVGVIIGTMADVRASLSRISRRAYLIFKMTALTLTLTSAISILTRATDEISAFAQRQRLDSLTVHEYVQHFSQNPVASASCVIASAFFVSYAACVAFEIALNAFSTKSGGN